MLKREIQLHKPKLCAAIIKQQSPWGMCVQMGSISKFYDQLTQEGRAVPVTGNR